MAIKYQDENGNWVTEEQTAVETTILDIAGNFESENVEGALSELAEKTANAEVPAELEAQVKANTTNIKKIQQQIQNGTGGGASSEELEALDTRVTSLETDMSKAKDDIAYLLENGGGGGGSVVPTIKSDFKDCAIDKGTDVVIPIFFTSPNMGDATAYITVNNIQVDTAAVKQGANNIRVKAKYLINTDNNVGIYVKDRAGMVTNRLNWMIIAGGIDLTSTFDYEVDYGITDSMNMGAAMAPAALSTLLRYFDESGLAPEDFDMILTGDLGYEGGAMLADLARAEGLDISGVYNDCGMMIFNRSTQDVHAGGSGCGCSAVVMADYIIPRLAEGKLGNVLFLGTGAMMSPSSLQQGCAIPAVAHLIRLESRVI